MMLSSLLDKRTQIALDPYLDKQENWVVVVYTKGLSGWGSIHNLFITQKTAIEYAKYVNTVNIKKCNKKGKNMRIEYEMSQAQLDNILNAGKPVPYMVFGGREPRSPQENANDAWAHLGETMGFDHMTVRSSGKGDRFFTAMPKGPKP